MDADQRRARMVEEDLVPRGVHDECVLQAMRTVPRERFVAPALEPRAYADSPLALEEGQTISQPYIVALMAEALALGASQRVLEVGTGSGYGAAVLATLCGHVYTIERHASLADSARARLASLGYANVTVGCGDGSLGWPEAAPFDAIAVAAAGPSVPPALLAQLAVGGRLVIPIGKQQGKQQLVRITRTAPHAYTPEDLGAVSFVPLIGAQAWPAL